MKGVILAGGSGTRLYPNTKVTNKHLLPVYNKPMIYYPIERMIKAGITDILILPGKDHAGDFAKLLGSGKDFNVNFSFKVQDHAGGLAYAVGLAKEFVGDDNFLVIFGDNVIDYDFYEDVQKFKEGSQIFCKQVPDPERFGVAELNGDMVTNIIEKPKNPPSNWAVIGAYIYDNKAFDYIKTLKPSPRGELEITDLNNVYIKNNNMKASFMKGDWYDTGTHTSLTEAAYGLMKQDKPAEVFKTDLHAKHSPKIVGGVLLYKSIKYLPYFLETLSRQDYANLEIYFCDNNPEEDNEDVKYLKENYPQYKIIRPGINTGFAKGHNILMREGIKNNADFYACLNFDMILEPNCISELLNSLLKSPRVASATCKIKRWDFTQRDNFEKGKTNFIDTAGLLVTKEHRFFDRGQGEIDHGQYDEEEEIFGSSGASVMFRVTALEDVAFVNENNEKEYFDELMFMYKEDVDLAYRFQWAGYKCAYNPLALLYHDRTIEIKGKSILGTILGRWNRGRIYKEWSWLNHHIILKKLVDSSYPKETRLKTFWYEFKSFVYILFFEPFLLKNYIKIYKLRNQIKARRDQMKKRIDAKAIVDRWM